MGNDTFEFRNLTKYLFWSSGVLARKMSSRMQFFFAKTKQSIISTVGGPVAGVWSCLPKDLSVLVWCVASSWRPVSWCCWWTQHCCLSTYLLHWGLPFLSFCSWVLILVSVFFWSNCWSRVCWRWSEVVSTFLQTEKYQWSWEYLVPQISSQSSGFDL